MIAEQTETAGGRIGNQFGVAIEMIIHHPAGRRKADLIDLDVAGFAAEQPEAAQGIQEARPRAPA